MEKKEGKTNRRQRRELNKQVNKTKERGREKGAKMEIGGKEETNKRENEEKMK